MSHYTVLVITDRGDKVNELLAPFNEELEVEPYIEYSRQDIIDRVAREDRETLEKMRKCKEAEEECYVRIWGMDWRDCGRRVPTDEDVAYAENAVEHFSPDEAHARYVKAMGDECTFDEEGNEMTTYNPNSKWDWYSIGGRWSGGIPTKTGEDVDIALVKDISWDIRPDEAREAERLWEVIVEGKPLEDGESEDDFRTFLNAKYFLDEYGTKERYVHDRCSFATYAVLTPDGKWHEAGAMGWFGMSMADGKEKRAFRDGYRELVEQYAEGDYAAFLVDCHI